MRAELARAQASVRAEAGRQVSTRVDRFRAVHPTGPLTWLRHRRVPVLGRLDPQLLLDRQRREFRDAVTAALDASAVDYWWLPSPAGEPPTLGVRREDRDALLQTVARRAVPSWYADVVDADGRAAGRLLRAERLDRSATTRRAPGLLLWEFVAPGPDSTFISDATQGLAVHFWVTDGDRLRSLVANLTAVELPRVEPVRRRPPEPAGPPRPVGAVGFPIDVVYTWVDGDDESWLRDKARAAGVVDPALFTERAHDASRFADHDELRFSLRGLEQFAPWVRHVWIVTADQHPPWLRRDDPWISVVSHRDLWPDANGLPTFNSHAIETCLHRIPGLAEHFVYLNDDMLIARPVTPDGFFHANGIGKFFASRALVDYGDSAAGDIASTTAAKNARRLLGQRYGVTFTRKFFHTAASLTVSGLAELEQTFPEVIARTRQAPFRTLDDVAMAGSFYLNWAYATGRSVPGRIRYTYIDPAAPDAARRLATLTRKRVFDAICVNDGSSPETVEQRRVTDRVIRAFFAAYLPVPGTFEVTGPEPG